MNLLLRSIYILPTFAQTTIRSWSFSDLAIALIVIIAVIAIVYVFVKQSGIPIPPWIFTIFWIVVTAVVCILAIRLLVSM